METIRVVVFDDDGDCMKGRYASNGFDGSDKMFSLSDSGVKGEVRGVSSLKYEDCCLCWMVK